MTNSESMLEGHGCQPGIWWASGLLASQALIWSSAATHPQREAKGCPGIPRGLALHCESYVPATMFRLDMDCALIVWLIVWVYWKLKCDKMLQDDAWWMAKRMSEEPLLRPYSERSAKTWFHSLPLFVCFGALPLGYSSYAVLWTNSIALGTCQETLSRLDAPQFYRWEEPYSWEHLATDLWPYPCGNE